MRNKILFLAIFAMLPLAMSQPIQAYPSAPLSDEEVEACSSSKLIKLMQNFVSLVNGVDISKYQDSKDPDWRAFKRSLSDIQTVVDQMVRQDSLGKYRESTNAASQSLMEAQRLAEAQDRRAFEIFIESSSPSSSSHPVKNCSACHSVHKLTSESDEANSTNAVGYSQTRLFVPPLN